MIFTLGGSQPSAEDFLKNKVDQLLAVESAKEPNIRELRLGRIPTRFNEVASGQVPQDASGIRF